MKRRTFQIPYQIITGGGPTIRYGIKDDFLADGGGHYRLRNGSWSGGGPLFIRHRSVTGGLARVDWKYFGPLTRTPYVGNINSGLFPTLSRTAMDSLNTTESANTFSYGATGWKRARPGNPQANLATMLGEAAEGIPKIPFNAYNRLRKLLSSKAEYRRNHGSNVGDEYLNLVFGWLPLWDDLKKMYELSKNLDARLAQIYRDNGKGIHRKREIKNSSTTTTSVSEGNTPFWGWSTAPPNVTSGWGKVETLTTTSERVWFAGRFRYYIPDIGSSQWRRRTVRALYGANLTPEVAWNLIPWSWLADWFGNVGDVMSNISSNAVDNLVADYAYIMRTLETEIKHRGVASWGPRNEDPLSPTGIQIPAGSAFAEASDRTTLKLRSVASPYGFGVQFDSLSNYQMGVIAALGISRW